MKLTITEAKAQGFTVDNHAYPPLAYKGPRSKPTHTKQCFTDLETELYEAFTLVHKFFDSLPKGWLGKTTGDIAALNDFYIKSGKIRKEMQS